tara:strand:+ start:897 stop:1226 length:330 start_codon:yes stop_codon:yes gene_type:complete
MRDELDYLVALIGKGYYYNVSEENCYPGQVGVALHADNIHCFSMFYNSQRQKYHVTLNLEANFGKNYYNIETSYIEVQDGALEFDISKNYLSEFIRLTLNSIESSDLHF